MLRSPYEEAGVVLVPLREVAEALGHTLSPDPEAGTVTIDDSHVQKITLKSDPAEAEFEGCLKVISMNRCNGVKRLSNNPVFYCDSVTGLVTMLTSPFTYTSDKFQWDGRKADSYAAPVDTENKVAAIASAEEPALFKYEVTDQKVDYSGCTAEITKDIDLGSGFWRPIDPVNNLTINGNGHTIRNLLIYTCTDTSGYGTAEFNTVQVTNSVIEGYGKIGCIRRMGADVNVTVTFKIALPRTTPSVPPTTWRSCRQHLPQERRGQYRCRKLHR